VPKITADEQQRFPAALGERVGKAVAEIQPGRMFAAFTEILISVPGEPSLNFGHRCDVDAGRFEQVIKAAAGDWVTAAIDDDCGFETAEMRRSAALSIAAGAGLFRRFLRFQIVSRIELRKLITPPPS
jgi:hypothetical protein